jgi:hypothetical protein
LDDTAPLLDRILPDVRLVDTGANDGLPYAPSAKMTKLVLDIEVMLPVEMTPRLPVLDELPELVPVTYGEVVAVPENAATMNVPSNTLFVTVCVVDVCKGWLDPESNA